jgi:hypothetical protein
MPYNTPAASTRLQAPSQATTSVVSASSSPPVPDPTADWPTYSSPAYSIKYPSGWYDLSNFGAPDTEKYFANEKVSAPLQMDTDGAWLTVSVEFQATGGCSPSPYFQKATIVSQKSITVGGQSATRSVLVYGPKGPQFMVADVGHGLRCYHFLAISYSSAATAANLPLEELVLSSVRFPD